MVTWSGIHVSSLQRAPGTTAGGGYKSFDVYVVTFFETDKLWEKHAHKAQSIWEKMSREEEKLQWFVADMQAWRELQAANLIPQPWLLTFG